MARVPGPGPLAPRLLALVIAALLALPAAAAFSAPEETQSAQIYYGEDAAEGEYPYAAYVESTIGSCTGSLVAANKVLTAAHCVDGLENTPQVFTVGLGSRDLNSQTSYDVTDVDKHENYDPVTLQNDVAMLTLDANAPETPVRVMNPNEMAQWEPGDILRIAGWGEMEDQSFPDILQEANVPRIDDTTCDNHYGGDVDPFTMFCAGDGTQQSPQEDTCQGDSGGPIMATDTNGQLALVGATSWGGDCGEGPGVYARVGCGRLNNWVKQRVTGAPAPPANDPFTAAIPLSGTFDSETCQHNVDATKESGELNHGGNEGGKSTWYTWTAPASGQATVDTCDGEFDTLIGVYTGSSVNGLTTVTGNDDGCTRPGGSFATFFVQQGQAYVFAVDGFKDSLPGSEADSGTFDIYVELTPSPPDGGGDPGDGGGGGGGGGGGASGATAGNDNLFGTAAANVICGLGGSDLIRGGAGNDTIFGDQCGARSRLARASARAAAAGDGNDRLYGDAGNDRLYGSGGNDRLFGGSGKDLLAGGRGNDALVGGRGRDRISGGRGRDVVNVKDRARDVVNCGRGRDTVRRDRRDRVRGCERVRR
jgi:trypsin